VLAQTFTDWECLCVDDGSTDESGDILDEYAQKDPRFRVFHKKNGGVSSARNLALDNVKGEWIGFLDGDDCLLSSFLKEATRIIETEDPDLIRFRFTRNLGESYPEEITNPYTVIKGRECISLEVLPEIIQQGYVWLCLFNKRLFINQNKIRRFPQNVKYAEDCLLMLAVLTDINIFVQSDCVSHFYRETPNSAVVKPFDSIERLNYFRCLHKVSLFYPKRNKDISAMGWFNLCGWCLRPKEMVEKQGIYQIFKSLTNDKIIVWSGIPKYALPAFLLYVWTGAIWGIVFTYRAIRVIIELREMVTNIKQ
jgi:glycosyltransferase involved in cell wall biosynthesis